MEQTAGKKAKVIFLDRDGTLNEEVHYLHKPEDLKLLPGVEQAVRRFNEAGYQVVVVTNQAGVARGYYTEQDVIELHAYLNRILKEEGAHVDAFYYCPHHPEYGIGPYKTECRCRKPGIGMFEQAEQAFKDGINKEESYMIGDKLLDVEAGHRYGVRSVLVGTGYGREVREEQRNKGLLDADGNCLDGSYDFYAEDLVQAAEWILRDQSAKVMR